MLEPNKTVPASPWGAKRSDPRMPSYHLYICGKRNILSDVVGIKNTPLIYLTGKKILEEIFQLPEKQI